MAPKNYKTFFIPGLHGQYKLWRGEILKNCNQVDKIIQMGNVIGCNEIAQDGPKYGANETLLKFMYLYRSTYDNWHQLVGPNEIAALNAPEEWTNAHSRQFLRNAWFAPDPMMTVATVDKQRLVTHGGLTYGEWLDIGSPKTAEEAADVLNRRYARTLYQGPAFRLGDGPQYAANPIWADPLMELYPSWITAPVSAPFDQVHTSGTLNSPEGREMANTITSPLHYVSQVNFRSYGSIATIKDARFLSIHLELPGKMISTVPRPQALYIEKS